MNKDVSFYLDTDAASVILTKMSLPVIRQAGLARQSRAQSMANSMSSNAPQFSLQTEIGTIKRGKRVIAKISAPALTPRDSFIAHTALAKSKDASRL